MKTLAKVATAMLVLEVAFAIHECGHLVEFQKRNIPIEEFSLGIGPILFQYQTPSFPVSIRAIPFMAYVALTKEGGELFAERQSHWNKIVVLFAGVRNNLLVGLGAVAILQIVGWRHGNISLGQLVKLLLLTPIKMIPRFFAFLIGCATFGRINLAKRFLLSTAGVKPARLLVLFIRFNFMLALINLMPIYPLDGGKIAQVILTATGIDAWIPGIPGLMFFVLFIVFFASLNEQDYQILEV